MTRTLTTSRRLAALGTALATGAALLVGGTAGAQTDTRIATQFVLNQVDFDNYGFESFHLVDADGAPMVEATGTVSERLEMPSGALRLQLLIANQARALGSAPYDLEHDGLNSAFSQTQTLEPGDSFRSWDFGRLARDGAIAGASGTTTIVLNYSGDARHQPADFEFTRSTTPAELAMHVPTTVESGPAVGGKLPITVRFGAAVPDATVDVTCAPYLSDSVDAWDVTHEAVATGAQTYSAECDAAGDQPILVFAVGRNSDHSRGGGAVAIIDPRHGGTTVDIDPATSLAPTQEIQVSGSDLEPNRTYQVQIAPSSRSVGTLTTGANGAGTATITIPDDLADGHHHIVLRDGGTEVERQPFTLSQLAAPGRAVVLEMQGDVTPEPTTPTSPKPTTPKPTTPKPTTPKPAPGGSGSLGGSSDMAGSIGS